MMFTSANTSTSVLTQLVLLVLCSVGVAILLHPVWITE